MADQIEELEGRRRVLETGVLAAACVWRRHLGSETEGIAAAQLLRYVEDWEAISDELNRAIEQMPSSRGTP